MPFKVVIVGCGIAGLAAALALADKGHSVTIIEATSELRPIGGSIVLQANANRVLDHLGVYNSMLQYCSPALHGSSTRSYRDGSFYACVPPNAHEKEYGYPLWPLHRADLQRVMLEAAKLRGVVLRLGCPVAAINELNDILTVVSKNGEALAADVVVGADGIDSVVRRIILPGSICVRDSGLDVTRATVPAAAIQSDPETSDLLNHTSLWCGPSTTLATMAIRPGDQRVLGLDCCHNRSAAPLGDDAREQDLGQLKELYKDYTPAIQKLLAHVTKAHVWKLRESMPSTWVNSRGQVVLIGDAAHASLPWVGQGGGMALEDGAVLAECLGRVELTRDIPLALEAFQQIRRPRCEHVQKWSAIKGCRAFLHEGAQLDLRDENFKRANAWVKADPWDGIHIDEIPPFESPHWKAWLSGHDAVKYTNRRLDSLFGRRP